MNSKTVSIHSNRSNDSTVCGSSIVSNTSSTSRWLGLGLGLGNQAQAEVAALGNSTLPTVCDKLNVMSTIHLRKLIATLVRENSQRDVVIGKLEERIGILEDKLNEIGKQHNTDVIV
jgi:hypothetical protein